MQPLCQKIGRERLDSAESMYQTIEPEVESLDSGNIAEQIVLWHEEIKLLTSADKVETTHKKVMMTCQEAAKTNGEEEACEHQKEIVELKQLLQQYWEFETTEEERKLRNLPNYKRESEEHAKAQKIFEENLVRLEDGAYCAPLLWKSPEARDNIRCNYQEAKELFLAHERRMLKEPELHQEFVNTVSDWMDKGFARYVDVSPEDHSYFIPTFMVVRLLADSTKFRLIMNGKQVFADGICINDLLFSGPNLMNLIVDVLMGFAEGDFALCCDLASMFLKIRVPTEDQHCLRFFFREKATQPIRVIQCSRHVFGLKSSPCIAMSTLKKHANDRKTTHPQASEALLDDIIVDDVLTSSDDVEELIKMVDQLDEMLPEIDMFCHKFSANDERILEKVEPKRRAKQVQLASEEVPEEKTVTEEGQLVERVKTLGIIWNCIEDTYQINYTGDETEPVTLRSVMRNCMRFYDPMGWFLPVQMGGRMLVQVAWRLHGDQDWDASLPVDFQKTWRNWIVDAKEVNKHKIPRCNKIKGEPVKRRRMAVFCDASSLAYAACVYLVTEYQNQEIKPTRKMVFSRGKVASTTKRQTIARLEAAACVLGVEIARKAAKKHKIAMEDVHFYTDSTTCLYWLETKKELSVYVGARICHIRDYTHPSQWGHVRTKSNPADDPSRAVKARLLIKRTLWWDGAEWLEEEIWPKFRTMHETTQSKEETKEICATLEKIFLQVKVQVDLVTQTEKDFATFAHGILGKYSDFRKAMHKLTTCVNDLEKWLGKALGRGLEALKGTEKRVSKGQSVSTMKGIFHWLIKMDQRYYFEKDIKAVLKGTELSKQYAQFNLFVDQNGVLRIAGRLKHTEKAASNSFSPILLSRESALTEAIARDVHEFELCHTGGPFSLWNEFKVKYYIVGGKQYCKKILSSCPGCWRRKAHKVLQEDGPAHWSRIPKSEEENRSFERIGIDMAGPFETRNAPGKSRHKRCFIIFACTLTRAVNLEMVDAQDGNSLYLAYKRHCSVYGRPKYITSDNGGNMRYLHKTIRRMWSDWESLVENRLRKEDGVKYVRNLPWAPWWGGNYESLIYVAKRALKAIVKWPRHLLNDEEFRTVLREISCLMNKRPLTLPSSDPRDPPSLRPIDFLTNGQATLGVTPLLGQEFPIGLNKLKDNADKAAKEVWERMQKEIFRKLNDSRKRQKGVSIEVGDLVLVANSEWPDETWPLGLVVATHRNQHDQIVRSATIYANGEMFDRSVRNLARLPYLVENENERYIIYRKREKKDPTEEKRRRIALA